jgi:hypothetical protein
MRLGRIDVRWPGPAARDDDDPYWDNFLNKPPRDPANLVPNVIRAIQEGSVFQARADVHTPEVMAKQLKELGLYVGALAVGVVALNGDGAADWPFAIVSLVRAPDDPRLHPGIGGQAPLAEGLYVSFILASYIRELGFRATSHEQAAASGEADRLAAAAGLSGRSHVHVANAVFTDLPLKPDGRYSRALDRPAV